jgi:hypothetical protein
VCPALCCTVQLCQHLATHQALLIPHPIVGAWIQVPSTIKYNNPHKDFNLTSHWKQNHRNHRNPTKKFVKNFFPILNLKP